MSESSASNELFYLKWSNFQVNVSSEFKKIQEASDLVDITFSCDGKEFGAHKLVLFACSPYFKEILKKNPCSHPVFFINGVKSEVVRAILDFMYMGEVHINNEDLIEFIEMAEQFKIRGVTKEHSESGFRRNDKFRKHKRMRFDNSNDNDITTPTEAMIEPKSEADYGDQSCQSQANGSFANVEYDKPHQRISFEDAGPSGSLQQHADQWLDEKHFMSPTTSTSPSPNPLSSSAEDKCRTKIFKTLEPCSCPLCSRTYSNISNLRQHMRLIHNPTSVVCSLCQKSFTSDLYLKRHFVSMHGNNVPSQISNTTSAAGHPTQSHHQSTQNAPQPQTSTQSQQQPLQIQQQQQQQQQHTVEQKHLNTSNAVPFNLYSNATKREYANLHTNVQVAVETKPQSQQLTQWYDSNKVE